jgi:signal transduction histidine kinase
MFDSVRVKLTLWYTGVLALVLMLFCAGIYMLMARKLAARLDTNLRTGIEGMTRLFVHEKEEGETDQYAARSVLRKSYFPRQAVAFYDAQGNLLAEQTLRGNSYARWPDSLSAHAGNAIQFSTLPEAQTGSEDGLRVAAYRITAPSMKSPCFVVISEPLADLSDDLELLQGILYVAVPVALALAGLGGWFLARKSLAPVVAMSESARNLDERLPVANPRDELGQLAATFNELLARLDAAFTQQRQFMADASHELRTPLSVVHTTAQVTLERAHRSEGEYRDAVAMMDAQAQRLARIVEEMFMLARADAGRRPLHKSDFYLDELVGETALAAGVLAMRKGVAVDVAKAKETLY